MTVRDGLLEQLEDAMGGASGVVALRRAEGLASLHAAGAQRRAASATYQMQITFRLHWTISTRIRILIWK